jgi:hypothetical protein
MTVVLTSGFGVSAKQLKQTSFWQSAVPREYGKILGLLFLLRFI